MASSRKERKKWKPKKDFWVFLFLAIIYLIILLYRAHIEQQEQTSEFNGQQEQTSSQLEIVPDTPQIPEGLSSDVLKVHMIDCGQGDCFLFEYNGEFAMIDCGPESNQEFVVSYMKSKNVDKLKFMMGSHQHEDHMGAMAAILDNFSCDTIYMPKYSKEIGWYVNLLAKMKKYHVKRINPKVGDTYYLGNVSFNVIGQLTSKEAESNVNNYSTVIKVTYGDEDIIMTGDAEKKVERKIIESGISIEAEVLKLGHHGSDTSTSNKFLELVNPEYALISCGVDNKYGHPCEETMEKLQKQNVKVYRTDEMGDIVMAVTPNAIYFDKQNGDYRCGIISEVPERMVQDD